MSAELIILVLLPLQMLSGGATPRESMPEVLRYLMLLAPTTHFVSLAQAILYRGAGFSVVWPTLLALLAIGSVFFAGTLRRVRRSLAAGVGQGRQDGPGRRDGADVQLIVPHP